jgi:hypothetical protein
MILLYLCSAVSELLRLPKNEDNARPGRFVKGSLWPYEIQNSQQRPVLELCSAPNRDSKPWSKTCTRQYTGICRSCGGPNPALCSVQTLHFDGLRQPTPTCADMKPHSNTRLLTAIPSEEIRVTHGQKSAHTNTRVSSIIHGISRPVRSPPANFESIWPDFRLLFPPKTGNRSRNHIFAL